MQEKIAIIDYGAGNLRSVLNSLEFCGYCGEVVREPSKLAEFDKAILPGVGAFGEAMAKLSELNFTRAILDFAAQNKPLLGICLGMQLLFESSFEFGKTSGLGLLEGEVVAFKSGEFKDEFGRKIELKIPHTGWNACEFKKLTPVNDGLKQREFLYFVHSFHAVCDKSLALCTTNYGYEFVSGVQQANIFGFQPHPEKSGRVGLEILRNFCKI